MNLHDSNIRHPLLKALPLIVWLVLAAGPQAAFAEEQGKPLTADGKAFYRITQDVQNEYSGSIDSLQADINTPVRKGQVIGTYTLDPHVWNKLRDDISPSKLEPINLKIERISSNIDIKQRELDADMILLKEGMASPLSVESKRTALALLKDELAYAREELRIKKRELRLEREMIAAAMGDVDLSKGLPQTARLVAPIDGNVIMALDKKDWKLRPLTTCLVIADTRDIFVNARVYLEDYIRLSEGMRATVTSKTDPKVYAATIIKLPLAPVSRKYERMSYYDVELDIQDPDCTYREGNSVTVTFQLNSAPAPGE